MITSRPPTIEPLPVLLTKKQTAFHISMTDRTVDGMVAEGKFPPFVVVGSSRRWRSAELIAWCDAGCPDMAEWEWPLAEDSPP
ncbi:MAG: hypothetical protein ABGX16_00365 [Pirellulales bacterium]